MRIYGEDMALIQKVTEFLNSIKEPEGFYLHVEVHGDDNQAIARWELDTEWALVTDLPQSSEVCETKGWLLSTPPSSPST